jgi:hypothetical protein
VCVQLKGRKGEGVKSKDAVLQDIDLRAQDAQVFRRDDENPGPVSLAQVLEHGTALEKRDAQAAVKDVQAKQRDKLMACKLVCAQFACYGQADCSSVS